MTPTGDPVQCETMALTVTAVSSGQLGGNDWTLRRRADPVWAYTRHFTRERFGKVLCKKGNWIAFAHNASDVNNRPVPGGSKFYLLARIRSVTLDPNANETYNWPQQSSTRKHKHRVFEYVYKFDRAICLDIAKSDFLVKCGHKANNRVQNPTRLRALPQDVVDLMLQANK